MIEPSRSTKHGAQWIQTLETHALAAQWSMPIDDVTAPALLDPMLKMQRKIPETASRVRQSLDAVFEDAVFHGSGRRRVARARSRRR